MAVRAPWSEVRQAPVAPWPACGLQPQAAPASGTVPRSPRGTRAKDERCRGKPLRPARSDARGRDQRGRTRLVDRSWPDVAVRRAHERLPGHAAALQPGPPVRTIPDHAGRRAWTTPGHLTVGPLDHEHSTQLPANSSRAVTVPYRRLALFA